MNTPLKACSIVKCVFIGFSAFRFLLLTILSFTEILAYGTSFGNFLFALIITALNIANLIVSIKNSITWFKDCLPPKSNVIKSGIFSIISFACLFFIMVLSDNINARLFLLFCCNLFIVFVCVYEYFTILNPKEPFAFIQKQNSAKPASDYTKLMECKELLDIGAITQEEFEKMKKDILSNSQ